MLISRKISPVLLYSGSGWDSVPRLLLPQWPSPLHLVQATAPRCVTSLHQQKRSLLPQKSQNLTDPASLHPVAYRAKVLHCFNITSPCELQSQMWEADSPLPMCKDSLSLTHTHTRTHTKPTWSAEKNPPTHPNKDPFQSAWYVVITLIHTTHYMHTSCNCPACRQNKPEFMCSFSHTSHCTQSQCHNTDIRYSLENGLLPWKCKLTISKQCLAGSNCYVNWRVSVLHFIKIFSVKKKKKVNVNMIHLQSGVVMFCSSRTSGTMRFLSPHHHTDKETGLI